MPASRQPADRPIRQFVSRRRLALCVRRDDDFHQMPLCVEHRHVQPNDPNGPGAFRQCADLSVRADALHRPDRATVRYQMTSQCNEIGKLRECGICPGASPRGSIALFRAAQARARLRARDYVIPDDIKELAEPTLAHRLIINPSARVKGSTASSIVGEILRRVPVPGTRVVA